MSHTLRPIEPSAIQIPLLASEVTGGNRHQFSPLLAVRRHWFVVIATVVILTGTVASVSILWPSFYDAEAMVVVQTRPGALNNMQAVAREREIDPNLMGTEIEIITSPELARRVVEKLRLADTIEFGGAGPAFPTWLADVIKSISGLAVPGTEREKAVGRLMEAVKVTAELKTNAIRIVARTRSPELSASIANTYAAIYLDFSRERKAAAMQRADVMLGQHLSELALNASASEQTAEDFRQTNGLISQFVARGGGSQTVEGQRLTDINAQLALASGVRVQKDAEWAQVRELARSGRIASAPQVLASPLISRLREQEAELSASQAGMASRAQINSPLLSAQKAQLDEVRKKIDLEVNKIVNGIASEAQSAQDRENTLMTVLARLRGQVNRQGSASVKLKELEAKAAADRIVYTDFLSQARTARNIVGMQLPDAELISQATASHRVSYPKRLLLIGFAFLGSAALGVLAAITLDRKEPGFRSAEEFEAASGVNVLGLMPTAKRKRHKVLTLTAQSPIYRETLNMVRCNLAATGLRSHSQVILVTSAVPGEGKSIFAVSLAASAAQAGKQVLLIDADLRNPSLASVMGISGPGLNALFGSDGPSAANQPIEPSHLAAITLKTAPGLHVIPVKRGLANPQDLLANGRLRSLIDQARVRYDLVLLDSPPLLAVADSQILSRLADETVLAVRWRKTPRALVLRAISSLYAFDVKIAGSVITQVNVKQFRSGYMGRDASMYSQYEDYYRKLS